MHRRAPPCVDLSNVDLVASLRFPSPCGSGGGNDVSLPADYSSTPARQLALDVLLGQLGVAAKMDPIARADPSKVKNGRMLVVGSGRAEEIAAEEAHEMMRWSSEDGGEGGAATPVIGGGGDQREMPFLPIKWHLVVPDRPQGWKEVIYEFCDNLSSKVDINGSKN